MLLFRLLLLFLLTFTCKNAVAKETKILLVSSDYYPHYAHDLVNQGPVSEIVRQAFLARGISITIDFLPFARAYRESLNAHYVALVGGWYSQERAEYFYYSQPLYSNEIVFFKRQNNEIQTTDYQELINKQLTLGLVQGYIQPKGLQESEFTYINVAHDEQAFKMLALGRVDLVPADRLNGLYLIEQRLPEYINEIDYLMPALELRPMYLLFSKKDPTSKLLMKEFNSGLAELKRSGEYKKILQALFPIDVAQYEYQLN